MSAIQAIREIKPELVSLSAHDSSDWALERFKEAFPDQYVDLLVGERSGYSIHSTKRHTYTVQIMNSGSLYCPIDWLLQSCPQSINNFRYPDLVGTIYRPYLKYKKHRRTLQGTIYLLQICISTSEISTFLCRSGKNTQ